MKQSLLFPFGNAGEGDLHVGAAEEVDANADIVFVIVRGLGVGIVVLTRPWLLFD